MKKIDGKECNTAKGVSIATEFHKFKDVLFNEKIIRHKMKRIQSKSINQEHMRFTKYLCHVLTRQDVCQMMEFVRSLMSQIVKRLKNILIKQIVITEKDCNNQKNIVMIEKRL